MKRPQMVLGMLIKSSCSMFSAGCNVLLNTTWLLGILPVFSFLEISRANFLCQRKIHAKGMWRGTGLLPCLYSETGVLDLNVKVFSAQKLLGICFKHHIYSIDTSGI